MQIEKKIKLQADAPTVWDALTNTKLTKKYFFGCEAISDWKVGSPISYSTEMDGKRTVHVKGVVLAFEPHRSMSLTCVAAQFEGNPEKETKVIDTLTPHGDATELSVIHGNFHDEDEYAQNNQNWDLVLNGLKAVVEDAKAN